MENKEAFSYTYSAKQREEINRIRKKYSAPEEDKMEQLRRIDRAVNGKATAWSLGLGIIGTLMLGLGLSCIMEWQLYVVGIALGVIGLALLTPAYIVYNVVLKKEREKAAPQVMQLIEEIENGK